MKADETVSEGADVADWASVASAWTSEARSNAASETESESHNKSSTFFIDSRDDDGCTALYRTAKSGHAQIASLLIECGADQGARPKLEPRLQLLRGRGAIIPDGGVRLLAQFNPSNGTSIDDRFSFVAGVPSASATGEEGEGCLFFEVEVIDPWIGGLGKMVFGLTDDIERRNVFGDHLKLGCDLSRRETSKPSVGDGVWSNYQGSWYSEKITEIKGDTITTDADTLNPDTYLWPSSSRFVVGVAVDLKGRNLRLYVDGKPLDDSADSSLGEDLFAPQDSAPRRFVPAMSGSNCGGQFIFNCGERPFKFPPKDRGEFRGFAETAAGDIPFVAAAKSGHDDACGVLLPWIKEQKLLSLADSSDSQSLLHLVAASGAVSTLRALVKEGCDVNPRDAVMATPAMRAVEAGQEETLRALCEIDADLELKDKDGFTALHFAAAKNAKQIVQLLLEKGADIETKNNVIE